MEFPETGGPGFATLALPGSLYVNNVEAHEAAGLAGLGLIQAASVGIKRHIDSGPLVEIPPDLRPEPLDVWLVVAHRRNLSRWLRAIMQWLSGVLEPYLD